MIQSEFEYFIAMYDPKRARELGSHPIVIDFVPPAEAIALEELRSGIAASLAASGDVYIEPLWNERSGPPKVRGFRARSARGVSEDFPLSYFSSYAERVASDRVRRGELESGDLFEYSVLATPRRIESLNSRLTQKMRIDNPPTTIAVAAARMQPLINRALLLGAENARDLPVFVHWKVLEQCSVLTRRAGAMETGGVLIGRICRDDAGGDLFLDITAQIPAPAEGALTKLSFTADTWSQVQSAINQRCTNEIWLGWWHSHSYTKFEAESCASEKSAASRERAIATAFLSEEDRLLHRVVFPRAESIALLITDSPVSGMSWAAFGWRGGQVKPRAFHLVDVPLPDEFTNLGENHATTTSTSSAVTAGVAG
jgi:hypothetical protein